MKLNSKEFEQYVINEIKNLCQKEQWDSNLENLISEQTHTFLKEDEYELIEPEKNIIEDPKINLEEQKKLELELKMVNQLNEELKRMRQLVDFRNPFFSKENN